MENCEGMRFRGIVLLQVLVWCLCQNKNGYAQQLTDDGPTELETLVSVGKTIYKCMSSKLSKAVHTLQSNETIATSVNNCWYRQEYGTCLSDNLGKGTVSHVTAVNNDVYPQNCLIQQVTSTKCISDALSEVDKYGCEARVVGAMKNLGDSPSSTDDLREAYCRASVTAYECVLSVVKYCGMTEGPRTIDSLTQFNRVRTACATYLPVTTTAAPVDIGPIGDLFPKSFFSSTTIHSQDTNVHAALASSSSQPLGGAVLCVTGTIVLLCALLL